MMMDSRSKRVWRWLLMVLLLSVMFGLAVGSSLDKSPTFDEGFYVARGWAFLKTGRLMPLGHPPLTNILSGLPLLSELDMPEPSSLAGWDQANAEAFSEDLLWAHGLNVERILLLSRLPMIWLGLILGAVIWRWARELYGYRAAIVALTLYVFSPNVLAHTRLAATDSGVAAFYVMTLYTWTHYLHRPTHRRLIIAGLIFGLAQAAKFSALFLLPTLFIMTVWYGAHQKVPVWRSLANLILMGVVGLFSLWSAYLFAVRPYPLAAYVAEFLHFLELASEGHRAYLLGYFSQTGWWWYHPFTLLVKMPLGTLLLFSLALGWGLWKGMQKREWELLFPAGFYLSITMLASLNVGIRYLLPMLPLMFIFAGRLVQEKSSTWLPRLATVLAVFAMGAGLCAYPHYIPFFNVAAGGSNNGYQLLADSNVDWGQDLPGLAAYLEEHQVETVYLSYFGQSDPAYYGIDYFPLPAWPPPPPDQAVPFAPVNPPPGVYAISASNLVGVQLLEQDSFGYFRTREPLDVIGYSILIYEVEEQVAGPSWIGQCAIPAKDGDGWQAEPAETEARLQSLTGMDELSVIYFDCSTSLFAYDSPGWLLLPTGYDPIANVGRATYVARSDDGSQIYRIWQLDSDDVTIAPSETTHRIGDAIDLLAYTVSVDSDVVQLTGWWRILEPPLPPVSILAHLLRPDGSLLVVADRLDLPADYWQPGLILVQRHIFILPADTPSGGYSLSVGLYSLITGERFEVAGGGDALMLQTIDIGE